MATDTTIRAFRRTPQRLFTVGFFLLLSAGMAIRATDSEAGHNYQVVFALISITMFVLAVLYSRLAIRVTAEGVVVQNLVTRHEVPWTDIEAFGPPPRGPRAGNGGLQIVLRSGDLVSANLYSASRLSRDGFADDVVRQLNKIHERVEAVLADEIEADATVGADPT